MKDNAVTHLDAGEAAAEIESRKNASDLSEKIKARSWTSSLLPDTLQISSPRASKAHSSAGDRGKLRERK